MQLFNLVDVPTWAILLSCLVAVAYYLITKNNDYFIKMGVSSPKPWPVVGNMYAFVTNPLSTLYDGYIERYGKVFGFFLGMNPVLMVADVEFIKQMTVKQFQKFSNRRLGPGFEAGILSCNLLSLKDEHWRHVRSQLTGMFTSGKLKKMQVQIDDNVNRFILNLAETEGQEIDIKDYTGAYTMDVIANTAFGLMVDSKKDKDLPLLRHAKHFFELSLRNPLLIFDIFFPALGKCLADVGFNTFPADATEYFGKTVRRQLESVVDQEVARNFIHIVSEKLIDVEKLDPSAVRTTGNKKWSAEGLTELEILSNGLIFFLAGYDTTATLLQFALYSLARHLDVQQKLRDEVTEVAGDRVASYEELGKMDYMEWVINETLRMYPPFFQPNRICGEDTVINNISIPKGAVINLCIYHIHHDPENWENPKTFNPDRFDPANKPENFQYIFLPFGAGPRNCIGMRLALLEAKAALSRIMQTFDVEVTPNTPDFIKLKAGSPLMKSDVPVTLKVTRRSQEE